ncbi:DUF4184 family protein [Streptomyces somaliensis DSM 40738]|nr:DUF4184 family protein [Streptomyces somaliensis]MCQ0022297.1 DUF4184 family protein [Streptomyces somaliensis DSM 40738]
MPFTLSHAAAVLPGIRRSGAARGPLVASGLVTGSLSPDVTYYADSVVPGAMALGEVTHGVWGPLTVDPLTAALLTGVWLMVREPLVALLPERWRGRVYAVLRGRPWRGRRPVSLAVWFYLSAAIGATTHVVWDLFTHADRWGVRVLPVLGESAAGLPLYAYAQYGGSAAALAVMAWFGYGALRRVPAGEAEAARAAVATRPALTRRGRWLAGGLLAGCVAAGVVHRCLRWYAYRGRIETPLDIVPTACFGAGAGLAAGLVLYGAGMRLRSGAASRS